jgi:hypothetical protein
MKRDGNPGSRIRAKRFTVSLAVFSTSTVFGLGVPSCEGLLTTFNPCGTIFGFCQPVDIDRLFADTTDFDRDPTCTVTLGGLAGLPGCDGVDINGLNGGN